MSISLVKRWIKALRSGKYKQGKKALRTSNNEFCCLGVLCDVANPQLWTGREYAGYVHLPPVSLLGKVHVDSHTKDVLIRMNDNRNFSFHAIANYLERKLKLK